MKPWEDLSTTGLERKEVAWLLAGLAVLAVTDSCKEASSWILFLLTLPCHLTNSFWLSLRPGTSLPTFSHFFANSAYREIWLGATMVFQFCLCVTLYSFSSLFRYFSTPRKPVPSQHPMDRRMGSFTPLHRCVFMATFDHLYHDQLTLLLYLSQPTHIIYVPASHSKRQKALGTRNSWKLLLHLQNLI